MSTMNLESVTDLVRLRWTFIGKVYGTLSVQLAIVTYIASTIANYTPFGSLDLPAYLGLHLLTAAVCFLSTPGYQKKHPQKFILLGRFTVSNGFLAGFACTVYGEFVLKGLLLTTVATLCLTSYTFWAAKKSKDLRFLEPLVFTGLVTVSSIILFKEVFYPISLIFSAPALCGLVAPVLLFSHYTLYNTNELMDEFTYGYLLCIEGRPRERYGPYDDYILATITLGNNLMIPVVAILSVSNVVASMRKLRESCISCQLLT